MSEIWNEKKWEQEVKDHEKRKKTTKIGGSIGGGITIDFPKIDTLTVSGTKAHGRLAENKPRFAETPLKSFRRRIRKR